MIKDNVKKSFLIIIESVLIDWECKGFHTFTSVQAFCEMVVEWIED